VSQRPEATRSQGVLSPDNRKLVVALLGVLVAVFALVFSNVAANHSPKPHRVPVGVVAPPQVAGAVASQLNRGAPESYDVHSYPSSAAAETAIQHRTVYGAFQPGTTPVLLVASAASPPVAALFEKVFGTVSRASGQPLLIRDVVPLPPSDSSGATTFSALLSLILAGLLGTTLIYTLTQQRPVSVRLAASVGLGISAGLVTALITNVIVGAFPGHFFAVWGVATVFVLAIGLPIAAFQALFGIGGTAIGWVLFLVIGNPASGGSSAPELLPGFWRVLSPRLPTGTAVTSMRDVVYFNGHGSSHALLVLGLYAIVGAGIAVVMYRVQGRHQV
jgi:Protein of unknown function (DUF3533)